MILLFLLLFIWVCDMLVNEDTKKRIIEAAEELHKADPSKFPTVSEVRSKAKADMNSTAIVMKEWRASKMMPTQQLDTDVPEAIKETLLQVGLSVWNIAKEQAEEKLRMANAKFDEERASNAQLVQELSESWDQLQAIHDELAEKLQAKNDEYAKLCEKFELLEKKSNELADLVENLKNEKAEKVEQLNEAKSQLIEATKQHEVKQQEYLSKTQALQAEKEELTNQVSNLKSEIVLKNQSLQAQEQQIGDQNKKIEQLQNDHRKSLEHNQELMKENEDLSRKYLTESTKLSGLMDQVNFLKGLVVEQKNSPIEKQKNEPN